LIVTRPGSDFYFVRRTLSDFQIYFGVDGSGIFAETQELRQRTAQAQRLVARGPRFFPAISAKDFMAAAVGDPFAFGRGFRFFGKKTSREADVHALARNLHGSASDPRGGGSKRDAFFTGGCGDRKSNLEHENGATGMRKKRGDLASGFTANNRYERNELAVQPGLANEQTGGDRDANPAIFQNIHGHWRDRRRDRR
jgi:hypothetical protein